MNETKPSFTKYNDFANENVGGKVLFATDDFFGICENMILDNDPVFISDKFTEYGKWMDGWETRRRRIPGHDWCIVKLATTCIVQGILIDTAYFTGNYAPKYSIQGIRLTLEEENLFPPRIPKLGSMSSQEDLDRIKLIKSENWPTLVPMTVLRPGNEGTRFNYHIAVNTSAVSHIRVNIYPDGGIARLRVFGEASTETPLPSDKIDLMSLLYGASCEGYSNAHFGHPRNVMKSGKSKTMADGWETARRLDRPPVIKLNPDGTLNVPGEEWAVFKLAFKGVIETIVIDTAHFKGNYPDNIKIEGTILSSDWSANQAKIPWETILPSTKLSPDKEHSYNCQVKPVCTHPYTHIRVTIAPDGGISRIRVFGFIADE